MDVFDMISKDAIMVVFFVDNKLTFSKYMLMFMMLLWSMPVVTGSAVERATAVAGMLSDKYEGNHVTGKPVMQANLDFH